MDVLESFSDRAVTYYKGRIEKILDRAKDLSTDDKLRMHQTVAFFYLNIAVENLPGLWEISGLFVEEKSEVDGGAYVYKCVCPPVGKAIIKYFADHTNPTVDVLVGHLIVFLYLL